MGLKVDTIQNPSSATVNLTLDTSGNVAVGTALTITGVTGSVYPVVQGTAQASTSGTSIDFTSIPSWVKRITIMFNGVSLSGTSSFLFQIGNTTPTTSGYAGISTYVTTGGFSGGTTSASGFPIITGGATYVWSGIITISNISGNIWVASGNFGNSITSAFIATSTGNVTLGSVLNLVRITTTNGTDTFDAGTINILYE